MQGWVEVDVCWWALVVALTADAGAVPPMDAARPPPVPDEDAEIIEALDFVEALEFLGDRDMVLFLEEGDG